MFRGFIFSICVSFFGVILPLSNAIASPENRFTYDARGRLASACAVVPGGATWSTKYGLDAADNRSNVTTLRTDIFLPPLTSIFSPNGNVQLRFQSDGNLVVYGPGGAVYWHSATNGSGATMASFQGDGHLVLYTSSFVPVWTSNTGGNYCATLAVANDGNVSIHGVDGSLLWQTNSGGH